MQEGWRPRPDTLSLFSTLSGVKAVQEANRRADTETYVQAELGLEVQREGCESMCPEWSNGSFEACAILVITFASDRMGASAGQKTPRGGL